MFVCDFGGFLPRLLLKSVSRPSFFSFTAASKFHLVQPHSKAGQHRETHPMYVSLCIQYLQFVYKMLKGTYYVLSGQLWLSANNKGSPH